MACGLEELNRLIAKFKRGKFRLAPPEGNIPKKRKPFNQSSNWTRVAAFNTRVLPLVNGRKSVPELVVRMGGKRKPRKHG